MTQEYGVTIVGESACYKIKVQGNTPGDMQTVYFTIVGLDKPTAFFFNSKAMESFQWITGKMTDMSRLINAGVPIENIIKDMKNTFQPNGGYFLEDGSGKQVHSVVHHLGLVLERHLEAHNGS